MSCLSVEYGYDQLKKTGMLPPDFLMVRPSKSRANLEGCRRISVEYSIEDRPISASEALKIWIDWKVAKRQLQMRVARATSADLLSGGTLLQVIAKAEKAAKEYRDKIVDHGIRITRTWEVIC